MTFIMYMYDIVATYTNAVRRVSRNLVSYAHFQWERRCEHVENFRIYNANKKPSIISR